MRDRPGALTGTLAVAYGYVAYLVALATVAYAVGFLANAVVPKSVDAGTTHVLGPPLAVNFGLVALFGLQHSLMARPWFQERWTRFVPAPVERSTYVHLASLALAVLMWAWRPLPTVVWRVDGVLEPVLWAIYLGGWVFMLAATEMIDGDHLMGLRQVRAYRAGRELSPVGFRTPAAYRYVRHPIMVGFLIAFWVTPVMTVGHLVFATGMTGYVLLGVALEERDLARAIGEPYRAYRQTVPRFLPRPGRTVPNARDGREDGLRERDDEPGGGPGPRR